MNFLSKTTSWSHHRCGWNYCIDHLSNSKLQNDKGLFFVSCIEDYLISWERVMNEPWVGFMHNVPKHADLFLTTHPYTLGLESMFKTEIWKLNAQFCIGIFCLSNYSKNYIESNTSLPVNVMKHPTEIPDVKFNWDLFVSNPNKKLVLTGHWMRKFQDIWDIDSPYEKFILKGTTADYSVIDGFLKTEGRQPVNEMLRLSSEEYDELLSKNIIHVPLYDTNANNSIIECIARNTPVLTTRLPSSEEYLGKDYPMFYSSIQEANDKIKDINLLRETNKYLANMNKEDLSIEYFLKSFESSFIYQNRKRLNAKQKIFL